MHRDHSIIKHRSFSLSRNMFKLRTMYSSNQTHHNSRWPSRSFNKEEFEEDSEDEEEPSVKEEDEVMNPSSVIPVKYLGTIIGISLMRSVHTV